MPTSDRPARRPTASTQGETGARPAAFLDRDGTLVSERFYLADPAQVELVLGAATALKRLAAAGYALVLVTNQSGIARGLYTLEDFEAVQARIAERLAAEGAALDAVYFCPHHPDFTGPCTCRKPGTALFLRAARELNLDLRRSVFIGDRLKDVLPARSLGGQGILVRTGYGREQEPEAPAETWVVDDLAAAAGLLAGAESALRVQPERGRRVDTPGNG